MNADISITHAEPRQRTVQVISPTCIILSRLYSGYLRCLELYGVIWDIPVDFGVIFLIFVFLCHLLCLSICVTAVLFSGILYMYLCCCKVFASLFLRHPVHVSLL